MQLNTINKYFKKYVLSYMFYIQSFVWNCDSVALRLLWVTRSLTPTLEPRQCWWLCSQKRDHWAAVPANTSAEYPARIHRKLWMNKDAFWWCQLPGGKSLNFQLFPLGAADSMEQRQPSPLCPAQIPDLHNKHNKIVVWGSFVTINDNCITSIYTYMHMWQK